MHTSAQRQHCYTYVGDRKILMYSYEIMDDDIVYEYIHIYIYIYIYIPLPPKNKPHAGGLLGSVSLIDFFVVEFLTNSFFLIS